MSQEDSEQDSFSAIYRTQILGGEKKDLYLVRRPLTLTSRTGRDLEIYGQREKEKERERERSSLSARRSCRVIHIHLGKSKRSSK